MFKTQKARILTAIILVLSVFSLSVSAEYANVDSYGFFAVTDSSHNIRQIKVGDTINSGQYTYEVRWMLSNLSPQYTYDVFMDLKFSSPIPYNSFKNDGVYYSSSANSITASFKSMNKVSGVNCSIEKLSDSENYYRFHVYLNYDKLGWSFSKFLLCYTWWYNNINGLQLLSSGVGCYYDPGGSKYDEILNLINQNVENLPAKIKQVLEQHDEELKSEASTEGAGRVETAKEALQNALPVSAVKDAITPIITACGYNGTDSKWQFPAMSIPAIPGLFEEIPLTESQDIDLTAYATLYIPETLLMLVRSLLTAGLIMFAIKELMSLAGSIFGDEHKGGTA